MKSSLVAAGVMSAVTLNAWWCEHCHTEHDGPECPVSGKRVDGTADDVHPDDAVDPSTFPLVGRMPKGTPVYGPVQREVKNNGYETSEGRMVEKVAGQWLYWAEGVFVGEMDEVFDRDGTQLQPEGTLADDSLVYKTPEHLKRYSQYFAIYRKGNYTGLREVNKLLNGHFVYNGYKGYYNNNAKYHAGGASFNGLVWIDRETGNPYKSPEEMPEGYTPNATWEYL
ncbi:MAG: hypothetical protein LBF43_02045 [Puniceicoccales bacterium]|jgi:hypothetical protein|nr:hypothetical protein [Puniceicoccales bacterium]